MPSVFLCHASEDKPLVEPIQLALANAGCEVFYDEQSLPAGGDYQARIHTAIDNCDLFVFIATPASIAPGKFTLTELKFARDRWPSPVNRVLPVVIGALKPRELPNYLQAATVLTVSGNAAAEVRAAVESMLRHLKGKPPRRWVVWLGLGVASGILAALLGGHHFMTRSPEIVVQPRTDSAPPSASVSMRGEIKFESDRGDYIGGGETQVLSDQNGVITAQVRNGAISIYYEGDDHWSLDFAAPRGQQLKPGNYVEAQRAAFKNPLKPGLDVSGAGRGCNQLAGEFVVQKLVSGASQDLEELELTFKQRCESGTAELRGSVRLRKR
jgi:TIR domain